ncbi:hypothetical protein EYC80_002660 [Monilinia laxa]|uniref:DUF1680-domain-containing protein n=1 Tax=Monilinia laxa TaxID=61186 RepID=A0A5N6K4L8_MONLA|nr:hypothetical protein EYC80_002660 [Monilinia laxa]
MAYPQNSYLQTTFTTPGFISRRRETVHSTTLLYQLNVLKTTGRYDAFQLQWHPSYNDEPDVWPVPNHLFWDSDVAKWIEGACYFLQYEKNKEIEAAVGELVDMIRSAQQDDGYLNIHFTVVEPGKRFTNLRDLHELYNAGHLIEAALAHNQHYGNDLLLEPILKYVGLLAATFGPDPGQKHGYPGHPEIELSLLRLYEKTGDPRHLGLARYFIDERGNPKGQDGRHYYDAEAEERGDRPNEMPKYFPEKRSYWYQQAHKPIVEQETIEGHAVRAMYLLTAVSDLVRVDKSGDRERKRKAVERLWNNMVQKKMYLTGGIGAIKQWEGFGIDYFLPSGTDEGGCYSETCAAIGVMMLAERILQLDLDGKYADIMELCFYNAVSTGMLLGYIGGYLWTSSKDERKNAAEINVHMYTSAVLKIQLGEHTVELEQKTDWPWDGKIQFDLKTPHEISATIRIRIPGWASNWTILPELEGYSSELSKGYLTIPPEYLKTHSNFQLHIPLEPRYISPHPYTNQNIVALARGPIVYCAEDHDNPWVNDHFKSLVFSTRGEITEKDADVNNEPYKQLTALGAATRFRLPEQARPDLGHNVDGFSEVDIEELHFIPYALRDNRGGKGHMRVGLRRR